MAYSTAVFDMDGTILNTLEDLADSVNHALALQGFPPRSLMEVRSFLGSGMKVLVHKSVPAGSSPEAEEAVLAEHAAYYPGHCAVKTGPYPGVCELLRRLKEAGIRTAVVSNKGDANVKRLADTYFNGLFDVTVGAREHVPRKPAPDLVEIAIEALGVQKADCVYIGDSDVDVATARAAGLDMITVLWGFRDRPELERCGASNFVERAEEIDPLIYGER